MSLIFLGVTATPLVGILMNGEITKSKESDSNLGNLEGRYIVSYTAYSCKEKNVAGSDAWSVKVRIVTDPVIIGHLYYYTVASVPSGASDPGSGKTQLYGFVKIRDPYALSGTEIYKKAKDLLVDAWDIDSGEPYDSGYTVSGNSLGSMRTDLESAFYISYDTYDGGELSNKDPFLQFYADILGVVAIYDNSSRVYLYRMYNDLSDLGSGAYSIWVQGTAWSDPLSGYTLHKNDAMTVNNETLGTGSAVYVLGGPVAELLILTMLARNFSMDVLGEYGLPQLNITYPAPTGVHFYNTTDSRLWAPAAVNYTEFFMAYSQFLLAQYDALPSFQTNYNLSVHTDQTTAWVVGWSAFLAEVIKRYYMGSESFDLRDLESLYDTDHSKNDEDTAAGVAGVLWDLYDAVNDDQDGDGIGDTINVSLEDMWWVVRNNKPTNIFEFIEGIISRANLNRTKVWELCWEHGINIDSDPPTQPEILSVDPSPSTTAWYNTSEVNITWSPCTDDFSGMDGYYIRVYHYENGSLYNWYDVPKGNTSMTIRLPTGIWSITVVAVDRARNENESLPEGPIKIDLIKPRLVGSSPVDGASYFDNESQDIVLEVQYNDSISGVDTVYIRYKYGVDGNWSSWIVATNNSGKYQVVILADEWKPHVGKRLYWEAKCVDKAKNVALSGQFYVELIDDDPEPPTIGFPGEVLVIYDSNGSDLTIWVNITDNVSGISNVTFVVYFGSVSLTYYNDSIMWNGTIAYVVIPRSTWINYVGSTISLEVWAYDADSDWAGDSALAKAQTGYGEIRDDDTVAPTIHNITVSEYPSGDGILETDEAISILINVSDISGVNSTITIILGNNTAVYDAQVIYNDGTFYTLLVENVSPLQSGDIKLTIKIRDLDNDGWSADPAVASSILTISVAKESVCFEFNATEIDALANSTVAINFTITRDDGGIISLDGQIVKIEISNSSGLITTTTITYHEGGTIVVVNLSTLHTVNDYIRLEFFLNQSIFASESNLVWIHVWSTTKIEISMNTSLTYSQAVIANITLRDMYNKPVRNQYVYIVLVTEQNETIFLAGQYTDGSGTAVIEWRINISEGNYTVFAKYDGSDTKGYYPSEATIRITVRRVGVIIEPNNITLTFSDGGLIIANISTELGVPADGAHVEVYISVNGTEILLGSNFTEGGYLVMRFDENSYPDWLVPGNYSYTVNVIGDDKYYGATAKAVLRVIRDTLGVAEIWTNASTIDWGDILLIRVFVMDDDEHPIKSGEANITLSVAGNIALGARMNITDGVAELLVDTKMFSPYQQITIAVYVTSSLYEGEVQDKYYVSIHKEKIYAIAPTITNYTWSVVYQSESELSIIFKDNDGKPVIEGLGTLVITIDNSYTIYNGSLRPKILLRYPFDKVDPLPGTYHIEISVISDVYEYINESRIVLSIGKIPTQLVVNISANKTEYGDPIEIDAILIDRDGNALAGVPITVYLIDSNGTRYVVAATTTNENGSVRITAAMSFTPGEYTLSIWSSATSIHDSSSYETKMSITKEKVSIDAKLPENIEAGSEANIRVKLYDDEGEPVIGVIVEIRVDDELLVRTLCNGSLSVIWIPDSGGSHVVSIVVVENAYYIGSSVSIPVKVVSLPAASGLTYGLILLGVFASIGGIFVISGKIRSRHAPSAQGAAVEEGAALEEENIEEEFLEVFESEELEL